MSTRRRSAVFFLATLFGANGLAIRAAEVETVLWDGLEEQGLWTIAKWSDGARLSVSSAGCSEGKGCLRVSFGPQGKQSPSKGVVLERGQCALDLDSTQRVLVDVTLRGKSASLALVLHTDEFIESTPVPIQPGLNRDVAFDFRAQTFKSAMSDWKYQGKLREGSVAWRVMFIVYPADPGQSSELFFDNVRVEQTPRLKTEQRPLPVSRYLPPRIQRVEPEQETVEQYGKFELTVAFAGTYQHPFDPDDVALSAVFESPRGKRMIVPGFLYAGTVDGVNISEAVWKIRFTPDLSGLWNYTVEVKNPRGVSRSRRRSFSVSASPGQKGFVRVSRRDPRAFEFDGGQVYHPIGQNVAWAPSLSAYALYFSRMRENGYNWSRVWMSSWQCAIEWLDVGHFHGLNNYSLKNAKLLDDIVELARKNELYFQLVLNQHGQLSTRVDPEWLNNPYNHRNGGPCATPGDFFRSQAARELHKKRLRYIVARWGFSPNIMAWELWNELTLVDDYDPKLDIPWQREMARALAGLDPYRHMITTSYFGNFPREIWKLPELSYGQIHLYTSEMVSTLDGLSRIMQGYQKPYFVGEFGASNLTGIDQEDPTASLHHHGIWAQYLTQSAGNAMPWEWDSYIERNNLYFHWRALARFNAGEDRRGQRYQYDRATLGLEDGGVLMAQGLLNTRSARVWIYDLARSKLGGEKLPPLRARGAKLAMAGMNDGEYQVELWNTYQGEVIETRRAVAASGKLLIPLPELHQDLAVKVNATDPRARLSGRKVSLLSSPATPPGQALPPRKQALWEGFEGGPNGWTAADWGDAVRLTFPGQRVTEGKVALRVQFDQAGRRTDGKGIVIQKKGLSLDLSRASALGFDVFLEASRAIEVSVALNGQAFCESTRQLLMPGWNRNVTFDLAARTWKTEQSRWKQTASLDRKDPIQEVLILFYPWDVETGALHLDNLGFEDL